uniref:NlpC/P60 domain-containing protein n=1 Tax=Plectus sambesii TaxID=2011161 RepID=A0A914WH52_9BILA
MKLVAIIFIVFALAIVPSYQDVVSASDACNQIGEYYRQGCSGLVAALLGRSWKQASAYRRGGAIGSNGRYSALTSGTIVGFPGHVAVYIGNDACNCMFVDVQGPQKNARCLQSYGSQTVYRYNY